MNSDPTLHNVHGIPTKGDEFNIGMPRQGMEIPRAFKDAGTVRFKCDVHPWMTAFTMVTTNPFYSVTKEDGKFTISNLPAGSYEIEAWHEKLGKKTEKITVGESDNKTVDFKFTAPAGQ